jgi:hypothetical protein
MKLYHATPLINKDNILLCGLQPGMHSVHNRAIQEEGIYGFTELKDALGFAKDQCWSGGIVVFSFDIDINDLILDPEYNDPDYGIAYFYPTEDSIEVNLEYEIEY